MNLNCSEVSPKWRPTLHHRHAGVCIVFFMFFITSGWATTRYVTTIGGGDGLSWLSPITLQMAIDSSDAGDSIWVAEGTYRPTQPHGGVTTDHRTFYIDKSIKLFGGFAGDEISLDQRDWRKFVTILDGGVTASDSVFHVLYLDGTSNNISDVVLDGFTIKNGRATGSLDNANGGGLLINCAGNSCAPTIRHCHFEDNYADSQGGGIFLIGSGAGSDCSPTIVSCTFIHNEAWLGGAMATNGGDGGKSAPVLLNSLFYANSATVLGGALRYSGTDGASSRSTIFASTFVGNQANSGGAVAISADGNPSFTLDLQSSIVWNNGDEIWSPDIDVLLAYSILDDGTPDGNVNMGGVADFVANLDFDPLFMNMAEGDFRLVPGSPAIDAGWTAQLPSTIPYDLLGKPRIVRADVDMGAFENNCPEGSLPILVDIDATGEHTGLTWADALVDLQDGIDQACHCDTGQTRAVWVADGIYLPTQKYGGLTERFVIEKDVELYGGFNGSELTLADRDIKKHRSVLSGDLGVEGDHTDNAHTLLFIDATANYLTSGDFLMDGFEITGTGRSDGGGDALFISANISPTTILNFANCSFYGHDNANGFGVIRNGGASLNIWNCLFYDNNSGIGAAIYNFSGDLDIRHTTFYGNSSPGSGGTILIADPGMTKTSMIANSIFWNTSNIFHQNNRTTTLDHCNYDDGTQDGMINFSGGLLDGGGNIEADPKFVDVSDSNFRLLSSSPSRNNGSNALIPPEAQKDLDGLPRQLNTVDMGPYENPYGHCDLPPIIDNTYGPIDGIYQAETPVILGNNAVIESGADVRFFTLAGFTIDPTVTIELGAILEITIVNCGD